MSSLEGIIVDATTVLRNDDQMDHAICVGIVSAWGGREFPLAMANSDTVGEDPVERFVLGSIWDTSAADGWKFTDESWDLLANDPRSMPIDLDSISQVYLIKPPTGIPSDDRHGFENVTISLFGAEGDRDDYLTCPPG